MKWLCKLIRCNHKICTGIVWRDNTLFHKLKCSRCGKTSNYWGYIDELDC